jgi:hypothetical protein
MLERLKIGLNDCPFKEHSDIGELYCSYVQDSAQAAVKTRAGRPPITLSSFHLPEFELACRRVMPERLSTVPERHSHKTARTFLWGHMFEAYLRILLPKLGYDIVEYQPQVELWGYTGHPDFIVKSEEGTFVIDAKTAKHSYCTKIARDGHFMNNERGYVTQMALYEKACGLNGLFIVLDKDTLDCHLAFVDVDEAANEVARIDQLVKKLEQCNDMETVYRLFEIPPLQRRRGHLDVLPVLHNSPYLDLMYVFGDDGFPKRSIR